MGLAVVELGATCEVEVWFSNWGTGGCNVEVFVRFLLSGTETVSVSMDKKREC